jgi:hypothetical protein
MQEKSVLKNIILFGSLANPRYGRLNLLRLDKSRKDIMRGENRVDGRKLKDIMLIIARYASK